MTHKELMELVELTVLVDKKRKELDALSVYSSIGGLNGEFPQIHIKASDFMLNGDLISHGDNYKRMTTMVQTEHGPVEVFALIPQETLS